MLQGSLCRHAASSGRFLLRSAAGKQSGSLAPALSSSSSSAWTLPLLSAVSPSARRGMVTDQPVPITVAYGDGIGPEIMESTMKILEAAGANIKPEVIEIGEKLYKQGHTSGISPESWASLRRTKVFLKAPITTPTGGGYKSLNVSIRKTLGLFANVRPCRTYHPFVKAAHPSMNLVIIRENEEDTYAGIEHRQTQQVTQCLKLITQPGCEKIVRYAFEYARAYGRKKVTCFVKDNIMKITDGLFYRVFEEIGKEYPDIAQERMIVDIGAARLADSPGIFDVLVMPNLYGDIMSDIAAQVSGSVGLGGSANIGTEVAMFEAIHGSAPDLAGKNVANPSGLLLGAVQMLVHIKHPNTAALIKNAWLRTIEEGIRTSDIVPASAVAGECPDLRLPAPKPPVGTKEFTQAIIERLGQKPQHLTPVSYKKADMGVTPFAAGPLPAPQEKKELVGVDVFLDWNKGSPEKLSSVLQQAMTDNLELRLITNRGVKVWPHGFPETFCTDHWRCRFRSKTGEVLSNKDVIELLGRVHGTGLDFIKTEHLYTFNGKPGFSLGQGE
ncbi:Isocitrate dehydrogenase [NADP] [Balamuthia mandrillaris]